MLYCENVPNIIKNVDEFFKKDALLVYHEGHDIGKNVINVANPLTGKRLCSFLLCL